MLPPPAIQGIGNAGGFQMQLEMLGGSFDYQKLSELAQQIVEKASQRSQLQQCADDLHARCAACGADGGSRESARRCASRSATCSRR